MVEEAQDNRSTGGPWARATGFLYLAGIRRWTASLLPSLVGTTLPYVQIFVACPPRECDIIRHRGSRSPLWWAAEMSDEHAASSNGDRAATAA